MEHRDWKNSLQETAGRHASRRGAFSAGLTALAVAAVLVFNLLAAQLPEQWAQIDLTGSGSTTSARPLRTTWRGWRMTW